mgnify:CR=1 FL=1
MPPRKRIEAVKEPLRAYSTVERTELPIGLGQNRHGDMSPEVATRSMSYAEAAELPSKHATKDLTPLDNREEIRQQHILIREILAWLRNAEARLVKNANPRRICLYKSPATQQTITDRVSPPMFQYTEREETGLAGPSSKAVGKPFLLPSLREPPIYGNVTDYPITSLPVAHIFEHPALLATGRKTGDPIKRDITPKHRPTNPSASSLTPHPPVVFHKAVPALPPPPALPVIDGPEVMYRDILEGLQLGLSAIMDSDVDFWVKEVVGASARRFLTDITALGELRVE